MVMVQPIRFWIPDGNVDKDASRRVEVKFRLKDDEMINELNQIMNTDKTSDSEKSGSN